jgi:hypothetical protein
MTGFLRRRSRDDSEYAEYLGQLTTADYDGTTWEGASDVGLPGGEPARPAAAGEAGRDTIPLDRVRELGYQAWHQRPAAAPAAPAPDMFPALPPGTRDTGPQQRLPRLSRTAARPRPRRDPGEMFIPVWVPALGRHVLLCGMCRWRRHDDPAIAGLPFGIFDALRDSALAAGWVLDLFLRWCCPACAGTPAYWSPRPVAHYHPEVRRRKLAGQDVPPSAEATAAAIIEHDLIVDVHDAARRYRHAAGAS